MARRSASSAPAPAATQGFTLLEVIITIALLMTITMAVASAIKGGFDVRLGIAENGIVDHRLSVMMQKINEDLSHAFLIPTMDQTRIGNRRRGTFFAIKMGDSDELRLTTLSRRPFLRNMKSSDQTYVVYKVEKDKDNAAWSHLYRGETQILPEKFDEIEDMRLLGKYVKKLKFEAWNGTEWAKFDWDSSRGEYKDKMPHMVKVRLEAWAVDPTDPQEQTNGDELPTVTVQSVISLPFAMAYKEPKERPKEHRYQFE